MRVNILKPITGRRNQSNYQNNEKYHKSANNNLVCGLLHKINLRPFRLGLIALVYT